MFHSPLVLLKVCCLQHRSTPWSSFSQGLPGSCGQRLGSQESVRHLFSQLPHGVNLMCILYCSSGCDALIPIHAFISWYFFLVIFTEIMKTVKPNGCDPWPSVAINSFCSWGFWWTTGNYYNFSLVPYILYATREVFQALRFAKTHRFYMFKKKKKGLKCVLSVLLNRDISQFSNRSLIPLILYTGLRWYRKQFLFHRHIPFSVFSPFCLFFLATVSL